MRGVTILGVQADRIEWARLYMEPRVFLAADAVGECTTLGFKLDPKVNRLLTQQSEKCESVYEGFPATKTQFE